MSQTSKFRHRATSHGQDELHKAFAALGHMQSLARPDEEAIAETAKETAEALQRMVEKKIGAENPKTLPNQPGAAQYIKYTPSQQSTGHNSGATTRIIKMQDMAVDPLEPPKFRCTGGADLFSRGQSLCGMAAAIAAATGPWACGCPFTFPLAGLACRRSAVRAAGGGPRKKKDWSSDWVRWEGRDPSSPGSAQLRQWCSAGRVLGGQGRAGSSG